MKKILLLPLLLTMLVLGSQAQKYTPESLPDSIFSCKQGTFHVQGMAVDQAHGLFIFLLPISLLKWICRAV
jgi:hypothetical protein